VLIDLSQRCPRHGPNDVSDGALPLAGGMQIDEGNAGAAVAHPVVTFHRPAVWPDAITLPAIPADPLRQLRRGAYEVIQAVLGQERMHEPPETIAQYRPTSALLT
jgi:hypothetical protein